MSRRLPPSSLREMKTLAMRGVSPAGCATERVVQPLFGAMTEELATAEPFPSAATSSTAGGVPSSVLWIRTLTRERGEEKTRPPPLASVSPAPAHCGSLADCGGEKAPPSART